MILRRYGSALQSVEMNFDSKALNEIGFRRDRGTSIPVDEFESEWITVETRELAPTAEGTVQDQTQQELLDAMEEEIRDWLGELDEGEAILVENENDDYPKLRDDSKVVLERGQNRLHFFSRVEPPLRLSRVRKAE
ncbi:MAG: hypothetical protein P8188_07055 [Gemmatimonadota bacterium]|jgi:hypothetical protein